jgi:sulfur relay (sulfurtransferase) complex TusBCD TusD component (DsrE family)
MEKENKICTSCKLILPLSFFENNDGYRRNQCKICRDKKLKEIRAKRQLVNENTDLQIKIKTCITCKKEKSSYEFNRLTVNKDGLCNYCRDCFKASRKKSTKETIKSITQNQLSVKICRKCSTEKSVSEFKKTTKSSDGHYHICNTCWKPREWNKDKQKISEKKYVDRHPDKIRAKNKRQAKNINRRIRNSLNKRIMSALKKSSQKKIKKTMAYTGCDIQFLKMWFEYLFTDEMTWENYGLWHIDHVLPCSSFDLTMTEAIQECFNWKNLRPCWGADNLEKSSHIISEVIEEQKNKVKQFLINSLPNQPGDRVGGTE